MTIKESDASVDVKVVISNRKAAGGDFALRLVTAESSAKESLDLKFNPTSQLRSITSSTPDTMVFTIPLIDDLDNEGTESMKFGLINVSNIIIAKPDTTRIMILDNDLPVYSIGKINKQTKNKYIAIELILSDTLWVDIVREDINKLWVILDV